MRRAREKKKKKKKKNWMMKVMMGADRFSRRIGHGQT